MKKQPTREKKASMDPLGDLIANDQAPIGEFPDGYVHFACIPRFGTHIVDGSLTVTGNSYEITRAGTKVDARDMDVLKTIKRKFYCPRDKVEYNIPPIGLTRL